MFRIPTTQGLDKHKYETRRFKGIYLGRDATSDEILVGSSTGVFKVRTIRRCSISERFDKEIFQHFASTPWGHRNDGQFYPKFLTPSNIASSRTSLTGTNAHASASSASTYQEAEAQTDQPDPPDVKETSTSTADPPRASMGQAPAQGEVRGRSDDQSELQPQAVRRRLNVKTGEKRPASLPAESVSTASKQARIARIFTIYRLPDGEDLPICVNEDELEADYAVKEPIIFNNYTEFNEDDLKQAMMTEKASLDNFEVKEEVPVDQVPQEAQQSAMTLVWVHVWNGYVKSRLCVRGFHKIIKDLDETYASTPMIYILRLLLLLALHLGMCIRFFDISTAFLHATLSSGDPIYVWHPKEFYPDGGILWRLKKAMYCLRTAPRDWQLHVAQVLRELGFTRLQSDANVYINHIKKVIIYAYVDDLLTLGTSSALDEMIILIKKYFLIKLTGQLNEEGSKSRFSGRSLKRTGDSIHVYMEENYLTSEFKEYQLEKRRPTSTTGTHDVKRIQDGDECLDELEHRKYRRSVGSLQWICPLRPDICYAVKELSKGLAHPTREDQARLKHLLRYLKGTLHYIFVLAIKVALSSLTIEIICQCDSDWAGDLRTRKSTSGFLLSIFGLCFHFGSRTQAIHAMSSGEAELYAIGTATAEALRVRSFLTELKIFQIIKILIYTDSAAGKSMATRLGISKRLRHVQLRHLFVQHLVSQQVVQLRKVQGNQNASDIFAKYVKAETLQHHLSEVGLISSVQHFTLFCIKQSFNMIEYYDIKENSDIYYEYFNVFKHFIYMHFKLINHIIMVINYIVYTVINYIAYIVIKYIVYSCMCFKTYTTKYIEYIKHDTLCVQDIKHIDNGKYINDIYNYIKRIIKYLKCIVYVIESVIYMILNNIYLHRSHLAQDVQGKSQAEIYDFEHYQFEMTMAAQSVFFYCGISHASNYQRGREAQDLRSSASRESFYDESYQP